MEPCAARVPRSGPDPPGRRTDTTQRAPVRRVDVLVALDRRGPQSVVEADPRPARGRSVVRTLPVGTGHNSAV